MIGLKSVKFVAVVAFALVAAGATAKKISIDNFKVKAKSVCGDDGKRLCATTIFSRTLSAPLPLDRTGDAWESLALFDVLGKIYDPAQPLTKVNLSNCSSTGVSPFSRDDLNKDSPTVIKGGGTVVSKAYATADVNYANLLSLAGVANPTPQLLAELKSSFGKRSNGKYDADGEFMHASLENSVIEQLKAETPSDDRFKDCAELFSKRKSFGFIWSIAIVKLNSAVLSTNIASTITADLTASLKRANASADLAKFTAGINTEITKYLYVSKGVQYRVISFDYY